MVTRKDFNLAAIRIFCDIIVADGYIVKDELVVLAKIAKDYKLVKKDKRNMGCKGNFANIDLTDLVGASEILDNLDINLIQNSYKKSFFKALSIIKEWRKGHRADVDRFVSQLAEISQVDGRCSPNMARIRLAVWSVMEKDAVICSIKKDYKFSKKEIIYIENDISDTAIVNLIKKKHWEDEKSDIWLGYLDYKIEHRNECDNEELLFPQFLQEYYRKINQELQGDFFHLQHELRHMGFDLVYLPQTISNLAKFGDGPELLLPALQVLNPAKLYGKEYGSVTKVLKEIRTCDFTQALMHECYDVGDVTPSLLIKVKTSNIISPITRKNKPGTRKQSDKKDNEYEVHKQTDFLILKIENGKVKNTIANFLSTYLSFTKCITHMVTEFIDNRVNIHGFDHTLLEYAINKVYGKEKVTRIEFDLQKHNVHFYFENETQDDLELSPRAFAFYLLTMCKTIPIPTTMEVLEEFKMIYHSIPGSDIKEGRSSNFAKDKKEVQEKLENLKSSFCYTPYIPICYRKEQYGINCSSFYGFSTEMYEKLKNLVYVKVPKQRNPLTFTKWFEKKKESFRT